MIKTSNSRLLGLGLGASLLFCACDSRDPALVEETDKLKQENTTLKKRLKAAEVRVQSSSSNSRAELERHGRAAGYPRRAVVHPAVVLEYKRLEQPECDKNAALRHSAAAPKNRR